jgi:hypothetical protein
MQEAVAERRGVQNTHQPFDISSKAMPDTCTAGSASKYID